MRESTDTSVYTYVGGFRTLVSTKIKLLRLEAQTTDGRWKSAREPPSTLTALCIRNISAIRYKTL